MNLQDSKKKLDLATWPRKKQFHFYNKYSIPYFNVTVKLDVTKLIKKIKKKKLSFYSTYLFLLMKSINQSQNFKYRIYNQEIYEVEKIHPIFTVLNEKENFNFCLCEYTENFSQFLINYKKVVEQSKASDNELKDNDDFLGKVFISNLPWLDFTSMEHPVDQNKPDSIPRIVSGKLVKVNSLFRKKYYLPLSIQVHHALADGVHIAKFITKFENNIATC